jgi:hypothetical protein
VVAFTVEWSPPPALVVASVVAATGRLPMVGPVGPVAGQLAQATNRAVSVAAGLPLLQRGVLAVRLGPKRALGVGDVPPLAVLDGLLDRPVPGTTALDRGRPFAQLPRPLRPLQLDRARGDPPLPGLLAHDRPMLGGQLGICLPVGVVLLLGSSQVAFAVGGTVGGATKGPFSKVEGQLTVLICATARPPAATAAAPPRP